MEGLELDQLDNTQETVSEENEDLVELEIEKNGCGCECRCFECKCGTFTCKRKVCCWSARIIVYLVLQTVVFSVKGLCYMERFFGWTVSVILILSLFGSLKPKVAIHSAVVYMTFAGLLLVMAFPTV